MVVLISTDPLISTDFDVVNTLWYIMGDEGCGQVSLKSLWLITGDDGCGQVSLKSLWPITGDEGCNQVSSKSFV